MIAVNTLFVKVVPQKMDRDYMLLCSFEDTVTHRTATQYLSLCNVTFKMIKDGIAYLQTAHNANEVVDVTHPNMYVKITKQIAKRA